MHVRTKSQKSQLSSRLECCILVLKLEELDPTTPASFSLHIHFLHQNALFEYSLSLSFFMRKSFGFQHPYVQLSCSRSFIGFCIGLTGEQHFFLISFFFVLLGSLNSFKLIVCQFYVCCRSN